MIHKRIKDRIDWFEELYQEILKKTKDTKRADIIFRRVVFEEN